MSEDLKRWERLEEYLVEHYEDGAKYEFTSLDYSAEKGLDPQDATADIQSHLGAQRNKEPKTLHVLERIPGTRTSAARWTAGVRTEHATMVGRGLFSDTLRRVERAFVPDLRAIAVKNPRAARKAERQINAVLAHAMAILEIAAVAGED